MALLNPLNAATYTLTFPTVVTGGGTVDGLGNPTYTRSTVTVEAVLTELRPDRLTAVQDAIGVDVVGIPVKLRAEVWPDAALRQEPAKATLTYNGRSAQVVMAPIPEQNANVAAFLPSLGASVLGILSYT